MVQGELRILDLDLAQRLGYGRPRNIRNLIHRHDAALRKMGPVVWLDETGALHGGAAHLADDEDDGKCCYLNKEQAIFITAKSGTPEAIRSIGAPHGPG